MAENFERVQLTEEEGELITGGTLQYSYTDELGSFLYSDTNPDQKYSYSTTWITLRNTLKANGLNSLNVSDEEKINCLLNAGLIKPI